MQLSFVFQEKIADVTFFYQTMDLAVKFQLVIIHF